MKAKVVNTGEIVDVVQNGYMYIGNGGVTYSPIELDFSLVPPEVTYYSQIDRREAFRRRLLCSSLQGVLANPNYSSVSDEFIVERCIRISNMTIEKIFGHGK